jgi:hypothetical protein
MTEKNEIDFRKNDSCSNEDYITISVRKKSSFLRAISGLNFSVYDVTKTVSGLREVLIGLFAKRGFSLRYRNKYGLSENTPLAIFKTLDDYVGGSILYCAMKRVPDYSPAYVEVDIFLDLKADEKDETQIRECLRKTFGRRYVGH